MGKSGNIRPAIALAVLILIAGPAATSPVAVPVTGYNGAGYVSLADLAGCPGMDSSFDIITMRGRLYRGTSFAVFQTGMAACIINGNLRKYPCPITRVKGEVLLPADMAADILASFYPSHRVGRGEKEISLLASGPPQEKKGVPEREPEKGVPGFERLSFIIIDAGHGGKDPGAIGRGGLREKAITLAIARSLERKLRAVTEGVRIIMTRNTDRFLELSERTRIANANLKEGENGLFLSIHVNASVSPRISGFETYYLSRNPSNEEARATAALENNVIVLEDPAKKGRYGDIEQMEAFMLTAQIQKESRTLAITMQEEMDRRISTFKSRGVRTADFFVLRGALMPAVLIETGFITNAREAAALKRPASQDEIAEGIAGGVMLFIKKYNRMIKN